MRYLSLFSGIEAATVAWHQLGWECAGVSEIEGFPCSALRHHYPNVPNLGDVTKITEQQVAALGHLDVLVFGSPCQDLSLAGKRKGFTDDDGSTTRSGLFFTAMQIIVWARKHCGLRFALWENVPGAVSSSKGADFAAVVGHLAGLDSVEIPPKGWGTEGCAVGKEGMVEWSTLDAQWFGVAQRRRRVFALADFGDWTSRPPLLLEPQSMRGDFAPSRKTGQKVAGTTTQRPFSGGEGGRDAECRPVLAFNSNAQPDEMRFDEHCAASLTCSQSSAIAIHPHCIGRAPNAGPQGKEYLTDGSAYCMDARGHAQGVAILPFDTTQITSPQNGNNPQYGDPCHPLAAGAHAPAIAFSVGVTIHGTHQSVQRVASYDEVSQCLRARTPGNIDNSSTTVVLQAPQWPADVTTTLDAHFGDKWGLEDQHINGGGTLFVPVPYDRNGSAVRPGDGNADSYTRGSLCRRSSAAADASGM